MFNQEERNLHQKLIPIYFIILLTFVILALSLISKSIFGHKYYSYLSDTNRTREIKTIAPRGVFFDRENIPLVSNVANKKYGYTRYYLYPMETAHLLGYMSLPDKVNLNDYSCGAPPLSNQFVGKSGLEKYYECLLRGTPGKSIVEINALGKVTRELARQEPKQGQNVHLTLSLVLQQKAAQLLKGKKGTVIATEPQTGRVLLFYSSPSFDNNAIVKEKGLYGLLSGDKNKPLFNRLTLGLYPPGSVIKPLIALGALEEGVINRETEYVDDGEFELGGLKFGNWYYLQYGKTEGSLNVVRAIKRSNDIFFYHLGVEMGVSDINRWLKKFGLNEKGAQKYLSQSEGLLPTNAWKKKTLGEPWYLGDTVNLSIGQGYLLVNPLQMHQSISVIANNGFKCDLVFNEADLRHCESLDLSQAHLDTIVEGMVGACDNGGTGWPFFDFKVRNERLKVACKTGTAESGSLEASPHAWFTVFAPAQNPKIILTVLLENGGEGSTDAAPIAKEILLDFFSRE